MIKRHPFVIFCLVLSVLIGLVVTFIQSQQFANNVRRVFAKRVSPLVGIDLEFSELSVQYFPPGISVHLPQVRFHKKNKMGLAESSSVIAKRIDFIFKPVQMFTGSIRVNEVVIVEGDVNLVLNVSQPKAKKRKKKGIIALRWDELFQIHADSIGLKNTKISAQGFLPEFPQVSIAVQANHFSVAQWYGKGGVGYELDCDLKILGLNLPKGWEQIRQIQSLAGKAQVNSLGLNLESAKIVFFGGDAEIQGHVDGNILESTSLPFTARASVASELAELRLPFSLESQGQLQLMTQLEGDLLKLQDTLKSRIELRGKSVQLSRWKMDSLVAQGGLSLKNGIFDVSVDQAEGVAAPRERVSGVPGSGGKIMISGVRWRSGMSEPIKVKTKLEKAHLHWLASMVQREIFPVDLRLSGEVVSDVLLDLRQKSPRWEIKNHLKLEVENFQLDNQRMGQIKPVVKVLSVPKIFISGKTDINSRGIKFDPISLSIKETQFKVEGGIDFKTGFDFKAFGAAHLDEIEHIAGIKIRGKGTLGAHIHGTPQRLFLDFMPDIEDTQYLDLNLGRVKGKITLDEDPSQLIFSQLTAENGKTRYLANGMLDLKATPETIQLKIDVPTGDVQDVIKILENKVREISWFPWKATGNLSGTVNISGNLQEDGIQIRTEFAGMDIEYLGERLKRVILTGGLDGDRYYVDSFRAIKKTGRLSGSISFRPKGPKNPEEALSWNLSSEELSLADLDHFSKIDVPHRGNLEILSHGEEKKGQIDSETRITLKAVSIRGMPVPPSEVLIQTQQGILRAQADLQGGQAGLSLSYGLKEGVPSSVKFDLNRFDFSHFLLLLNPKLIQDQDVLAYASGAVDMQFNSGKIELGSGRLAISEYVIQKKNVKFELDRPGEFPIRNGTFKVDQLALNGKDSRLKVTLNSSQAEVAGLITGSLGLEFAEFFTPVIQDANGEAKFDLSMTGYLKKPDFIGKVSVSGGSFRVSGTDLVFENLSSQLQLRQNRIFIKTAEADLASGRVLANGTVDLFANKVPTLQLRGNVIDNKIKVFPFQFVKIRGDVHVHGEELPYTVDGNIQIDSALSREKVLSQNKNVSGKDRFSPPATLLNEGNVPVFKLNIDTKAERNILVQNDLFDAELKGHLKIVNTLENPGILGTAEVIQGKMSFKDRVFQIQSGKAEFDQPSVIDPIFNLVGATEVNRTKIQILASGRLEKYKIELSSNPVLSESEILSILALGMSNDDFQRMRVGDRRAYEQGEAASLLLNTLDFNRDIQKRTGFQIQLDEATNSQLGMSLFRPRNELDSISAPRIVVRRKLGRKLEVSLGSTVGVGATNQRQVMTEYRFTPAFSLLGVWDYIEGIDTKNTDQTSYGVDLKLQKRFK